MLRGDPRGCFDRECSAKGLRNQPAGGKIWRKGEPSEHEWGGVSSGRGAGGWPFMLPCAFHAVALRPCLVSPLGLSPWYIKWGDNILSGILGLLLPLTAGLPRHIRVNQMSLSPHKAGRWGNQGPKRIRTSYFPLQIPLVPL